MKTIRAMPVLEVADVAASSAYYQSLGFHDGGPWGDPPGFAILQRGDVTLALSRACDGPPRVSEAWAAYVYVDDIETLHAEFAAAGAQGLTEIRTPPHYGCRDFDIRDPDGHTIAFGQSNDPRPGPGLSENRGRG